LMKIGVAGPFSGPRSAFGELLKRGVEQAKAEAALDVDWVVRDDAADPSRVERLAQELIGLGVVAVIGHFNSACALRAIPLYRRAGVLFLAPASTHPDLTAEGAGLVFRFCPHDRQQVDAVASFLQARGLGRPLVVCDDTLYGRSLAEQCQRFWGAEVRALAFERLMQSPRDGVDAEAIFFAGIHFNSAQLIHALRQSGYAGAYIASDDSKIEEFAALARGAAEGAYVLGLDQTYEQTSYLAAHTLLQALSRHPEQRGAALARSLRSEVEGVHFTKAGERIGVQWSIWQIRGEGFRRAEEAS